MIYFFNIVTYLFSIWLFIYCLSFSIWLWKKNNKAGAVMSCLLATLSVTLLVWKVAIY